MCISARAPPTVAAAPAAAPAPRPRKPRSNGPAKLFVLDTNVLMHDPMSLFRFEEHDVFLPMITLEELDGHKKGMSEVARNARQVSRDLDALASFTARNGAIDTAAGIELATVSFTHLTLPTSGLVWISVGAGFLKKKKTTKHYREVT